MSIPTLSAATMPPSDSHSSSRKCNANVRAGQSVWQEVVFIKADKFRLLRKRD
jgi:hypothetical protein